MLACAALMLTACTGKETGGILGGGKPFEELASVMEETGNALEKGMREVLNDPSVQSMKELNARLDEKTKSCKAPFEKALKSLDGVMVETEVAEGTGLTIEKGFTMSAIEEDNHVNLELKASVKAGEDVKPGDISAFGYEGDTPVILFARSSDSGDSGSIAQNTSGKLSWNKEEGTVSFVLPSDPTLADNLAGVDKIVLSTDKELATQMRREQEKRSEELLHSILSGEARPESKAGKSGTTLNKALFGNWSDGGDGTGINMELNEKQSTYEGRKGYGILSASIEYEPIFTLVFTSLTPDGDNIKVHYDQMVSYLDGDPDDPDGECEWVTEKKGEGDLTLIPQGKKVKIDSKDKDIKNKVLSRI